jgi:Lamin Tail Domain
MRKTAAVLGSMVLGIATMLGIITMLGPAAQASSSPVVIREIYYNSPGPDRGSNTSLNAEWVKLLNRTGHRITLTHWTLRDRAGHVYRFGTYRLRAHGSVKIHTGRGTNTQANRYWGHRWYIWNNNGDRATLKNASGTVRSRCSYSDPSEVRAFKIC